MMTTMLLGLFGATQALKVAVSGAGGATGGHVFNKLLKRPGVEVVGWTRSDASRDALMASSECAEACVAVVDICDAAACLEAVKGCDALVIATSAKPAPTGEMTAEGRPVFGFPNGQPEQVDWLGQKNQIDACLASGNKPHVVICSSMGGTNPENPLNKLGRSEDARSGNILMWKRKAEKYLIDSGLPYTIVHPGGLLNEAGGERQLVVGVDDEALEGSNRSIPREDVASVLVAALFEPAFRGKSFDLRSEPVGKGAVTPPSCVTLVGELGERTCDYSKGVIPKDPKPPAPAAPAASENAGEEDP